MASPLEAGKRPVNLAAKAAPGSRIRRDPPPVVKQTVIPDRDDYDRRTALTGIVAFALAIVVVAVAFGSWAGWSPRQYEIHVRLR